MRHGLGQTGRTVRRRKRGALLSPQVTVDAINLVGGCRFAGLKSQRRRSPKTIKMPCFTGLFAFLGFFLSLIFRLILSLLRGFQGQTGTRPAGIKTQRVWHPKSCASCALIRAAFGDWAAKTPATTAQCGRVAGRQTPSIASLRRHDAEHRAARGAHGDHDPQQPSPPRGLTEHRDARWWLGDSADSESAVNGNEGQLARIPRHAILGPYPAVFYFLRGLVEYPRACG